MPEKCDLDKCSLKDDIGEIKTNQKEMKEAHGEMVTTQALLAQELGTYMKRGEKEHDLLFARTRLVVKWPHLATAVFVLGTIVGIVWKLASGGGP